MARRWPAVCAAALALAGCATRAAPPAAPDVLAQVIGSNVRLRAEREGGARRSGSGVVIASDAASQSSWVVTTRHFLDPAATQRVWVTAPGVVGRLACRVAAVSDRADLALLEVTGAALPAALTRRSVPLGDDVWIVAYPWGRRLTVVSGIVSQLESDDDSVPLDGAARMVDASVSYGASGGGVFDRAGRLVGIVESYRTAKVQLERPSRVVDVPVPGETTVISTAQIVGFLEGLGLARLLRE